MNATNRTARRCKRAFVIAAALLGLAGCVYAPAPYGYTSGAGYSSGAAYYAPSYAPGYYYGPSIGFSYDDGHHWRR